MSLLLLKAIFFGFIVAAPVGPVGAIVIKRTLKRGLWMGFFTGAGSALGDTLYASVAAMGLSAVQVFIAAHEQKISFGGGIILLFVGLFSLRKNFRDRKNAPSSKSALADLSQEMDSKFKAAEEEFEKHFRKRNSSKLVTALRAMGSSFLLTVSNPVTILGFAGTFAAFGFWSGGAPASVFDTRYAVVVGGIMLGAMSWWLLLSSLVDWLGNRLSSTWIFRIHLSTSLVIVASALMCFFRAIMFW